MKTGDYLHKADPAGLYLDQPHLRHPRHAAAGHERDRPGGGQPGRGRGLAAVGPPNAGVSTADCAFGLHANSLVADGGTLQIGIGSLGDAIAQALIVRDRHGAEYRHLLDSLCPDGLGDAPPPGAAPIRRELGRFDQGLHGGSEMFVNGFLKLIEAGIIRREVFGDTVLQQLLNSGRITGLTVTPQTLRALLEARGIASPLSAADLAFLIHYGIFKPGVLIESVHLVLDGVPLPNDLLGASQFDAICKILADLRGQIDSEVVKRLKKATQHPLELVTMAVKSLWQDQDAPQAYLERLGLDDATSFKTLFIRRRFAANL